MRNSDQSNSSQRRGQKNRRPGGKNNPRGANGQRHTASNDHRSGQQKSSTGQRNAPSRGKSRNEISQAWASDTTTLSSHMPTLKRTEWDPKAKRNDSKNSSGPGSRIRDKNKPSNNKNRQNKFDRGPSRNKPHSRSNSSPSEKPSHVSNREAVSHESGKQVGNIDAFELFCAYHLGITKDKGYRTSNINEVANRFRSEPGMIKQALKEYDMDPESLLNRDFDMALAQLDIQVAPEGVDRLELARGIYQDFQDAPRIKRDWNKILEEDRKENKKIFRD
ncbi:MAG: hypothetical protein OEZ51_00345 [Nitrospinota bacterium]|nr:hypothetical protein [Nitrospinota bacterium]